MDDSWQPGFVSRAVAALAQRTRTWVYVSSCSVYTAHDTIGADASADLLPALEGGEATMATYGEAKVACEHAVVEGIGGGRALIARAGLIAGAGDRSGRTGYWPMRFAHPAAEQGAVLVPSCPDLATQVLDVRDLASWLVHCIEVSAQGTFNARGPMTRFADHLDAARRVASHIGPLVTASSQWLAEHEVNPLEQTLADVLDWEVARGTDRDDRAGLSPQEERQLIGLPAADRGCPQLVVVAVLTVTSHMG